MHACIGVEHKVIILDAFVLTIFFHDTKHGTSTPIKKIRKSGYTGEKEKEREREKIRETDKQTKREKLPPP